MASIRIAVPNTAKPDETIEIKALIQHPMESGYRRDSRGRVIPRDIITRFECHYNEGTVFAADFGPGVAANPYLSFTIRATTPGPLDFIWTDQNGESWTETRQLSVT